MIRRWLIIASLLLVGLSACGPASTAVSGTTAEEGQLIEVYLSPT